jgi:hypothetical protein
VSVTGNIKAFVFGHRVHDGLGSPPRTCSPRCRAKRHRLRQADKVREARELLEAALKRLEAK